MAPAITSSPHETGAFRVRSHLAEPKKMGMPRPIGDGRSDGLDSMHKTGILPRWAWFLGFRRRAFGRGHSRRHRLHIDFAEKLGYTIKLLAWSDGFRPQPAPARERGRPAAPSPSRFGLSALAAQRPCSRQCHDVYNGVSCGRTCDGRHFFYGRGAGKDATASAVLSDIADVAGFEGKRHQEPHSGFRPA